MDLSKFAAPSTPAAIPPANPPAPVFTTPAATSGNPLAAKLASLNAGLAAKSQPANIAKPISTSVMGIPAIAKLDAAMLELKNGSVQAEAAAITAKSTEVPPEIYTLESSVLAIQGFQAEQFSTCLASTYRALHEDQPNLATLLEAINKNLRQYEELSYLLTEPQLGLYFQGLMKVTGTKIAAKPAKKSDANLQLAIAKKGGQLDLSAF